MTQRSLRIATLFLIGMTTAFAADPPSAPAPTGDVETVVVHGKRVPIRKSIVSFVSGITRLEGDLVSRWRDPVCPYVVTMSEKLHVYVRERLLEIAESVPVRSTRKADCEPNLFVVLTPDPDEFVAQWKQRDGGMFRWKPRAGVARSESGPVRTWHRADLEPADGSPTMTHDGSSNINMNGPMRTKVKGSRIEINSMEAMSVAVILIDANALTQVTPRQLADYIAMRSFAKVDTTADLSSTPTILRLFAPEGGAPAELTEFDRAFLRGLYRTAYTPANQRLAISASMTRQLTRRD
jgi:hypothetical protein